METPPDLPDLPDPRTSHRGPPPDGQPVSGRRSSPLWPSSSRRLGATLRLPWVRVLTTTLLIVAVLDYILGSILPGGLGGLKTRLFPPTATRVVLPTATPILPTPAPVAGGLLAPPPAECPAAASLDTIMAQPSGFSQSVQLFGRSPAWVPQGYLPQNPTILSQSGSKPASYPLLTILWETGPTQHPAVTARMIDIQTGELAWWANLSGLPATPVLTIPASQAAGGWMATPTTVAITHAGCYKLDVSWTGGGWYTIVAIGGSSPSAPAASPA